MIALLLACSGTHLPTHTLSIGPNQIRVEIADTDETRARGLMHRDTLGWDDGMLFVYPDSQIRGFWMKNTTIPLSIAFLNDRGEIVRIADMAPLDEERVSSLYPARYALEMNRGWFAARGIEKGALVTELPETRTAE